LKICITNGKILSPEPMPDGFGIFIDGENIVEVKPVVDVPEDFYQIDADGYWVVPGLIDIHIHGSLGTDTMDKCPEAMHEMACYFTSKGVTRFLPTTVASSTQNITKAIDRIRSFRQPSDGARVLGIHLEGPYLGTEHKGAQPEEHLRMAHPDEYIPWLESGLIKMFTVAPEVDGVLELIEMGSKMGVNFAVGHSSAPYDIMVQAIDRGLSQVTHIFNGMPSLHHRQPGVLGAVLTDNRVYAQVISDGVHLHPVIVKLIFITKGIERTVLITDAIRATGVEDGLHALGDQMITVKEGIARTESGSLAGSTLTMDQAVRNAIKFSGKELWEVIRSATSVPAESIGLSDRIGSIKPGFRADLLFLDEKLYPCRTLIAGKTVYQKNKQSQNN